MAGFAGKKLAEEALSSLYKNFGIKRNPKPSKNHFDGLGF
jgi:hypothetical protein